MYIYIPNDEEMEKDGIIILIDGWIFLQRKEKQRVLI